MPYSLCEDEFYNYDLGIHGGQDSECHPILFYSDDATWKLNNNNRVYGSLGTDDFISSDDIRINNMQNI